jgi:hypothetical protein
MPDPHVTIPDEDPIVQYTVGGSPDDEFTIPFSFFSDGTGVTPTDIVVYDDAVLLDPSVYTVAGNAGTSGGFEGGTVTLDTPVTNSVITILRDVPAERTTDFPLSGPFNITALNTQLDKNFAILQQYDRIIDNCVKFPDTDATARTSELPVAATRASKVLVFDADGDVTVSTLTITAIETGSTTAEQWANKTDGAVSGGEYSAKAYAIGGTGVTNTAGKGAAKEWATAAEDDTVDGTEFSAKHYSIKASASASTASTQASTATTKANEASASAAAALVSELAAAASAGAGMYDAVQNKSANFNIVAADEGDLFRVDTSGGGVTATLDTIANLGDFKIAIAKITGDANTVTITRGGSNTINGATSYSLDSQYESVTLISKSGTTDWLAIGGGASTSGFSAPDVFSGDGADTTFTLSRDPGSENNLLVTISGVVQQRSTYSVSGTTLTFSTAPANAANNIEVSYLGGVALDIGVPSSGSVDTDKLAGGAVTGPKLGAITSAELRTAITDETGSGAAVFATSPTLVTPTLGAASATSIDLGEGAVSVLVPKTAFTPAIIGLSAAGAGTYSVQTGFFSVVDNMVFVSINLVWSAHTGTGNMAIDLSNIAAAYRTPAFTGPLSIAAHNLTTPANSVPQCMAAASTTRLNLYSQTEAANVLAALTMDTAGELYITGFYFI